MLALHHSICTHGGYRYLRFEVTARRGGSDENVQLSELQLLDRSGSVFAWPEGMSVSSEVDGIPVFAGSPYDEIVGRHTASESPDRLFDGSVSTKYCVYIGHRYPVVVTVELGRIFPIGKGWSWRWYTANDGSWRDPVSFSLSASRDGVAWKVLDSVSNATITTSRNALAYTGEVA